MLEDWAFLEDKPDEIEMDALCGEMADLVAVNEELAEMVMEAQDEAARLERKLAFAGWLFLGLAIASAVAVLYAAAHGNLWMSLLAGAATAVAGYQTLKIED